MNRRLIDLKDGLRRGTELSGCPGAASEITDLVVIDKVVALLLLPKETEHLYRA